MFKKYRAASACTLRVGDVDGVAAVVLVGVADVVTSCRVGSPCFSDLGDYVSLDFAS